MCLGQINPEKTKEYRALGTITMYKALKIVDGKPLSLFYGHVWVPGNVMLSSRDTPTLTDFEEATGQVTHGFHFYLYKSPAIPVPRGYADLGARAAVVYTRWGIFESKDVT